MYTTKRTSISAKKLKRGFLTGEVLVILDHIFCNLNKTFCYVRVLSDIGLNIFGYVSMRNVCLADTVRFDTAGSDGT